MPNELTEADLAQILRVAERADWPSEVFALVYDLRAARANVAPVTAELARVVAERDRLLAQLRQAGSGPADAVVVAGGSAAPSTTPG